MAEYKVFFQIFNKKMQCTISCKSEKQIEDILASKIIIDKIEKQTIQNNFEDDSLEYLKNIFGFK